MADTWIKNKNGALIARIRLEDNGNQRIYLANGHYVGMYNSNTDTTHYANGSLFAQGNVLTALINF